jgi:hypothetical protein
MAKRISDAEWRGDLKSGAGSLKLGSGAFEGQYSYKSRFEDGTGTNPEELIAAAHAACFSMAVSAALTGAGHPPTRIHTVATVNFPSKKSLKQRRSSARSRKPWRLWKSAWWPDCMRGINRYLRRLVTSSPFAAAAAWYRFGEGSVAPKDTAMEIAVGSKPWTRPWKRKAPHAARPH